MGEFIPPTDGKVTAKSNSDTFIPPTDSVELKKKDESKPTSTHQKLVSGTPTGSSGGVNPAFKSSIPSPIPDFNSVESVKSVVQKPKIKLQKPPVKEDTSFFDYLKENLDTGLATVSKSIYDTPGLVYDAAASITNPIFRAMGVGEDKLASSDKLANDLGFKNIPSEILKEKIKVSNEKINAYSAKNGGDALQAVQDGNYVGAAKLVAGTTAQSLPIMIAAMASGGESMALTAIGVSTASTKNAQLKDENPEMALGTRVLNSANAGIIEAVTGHLFTGASGAVMKKIIADKGVEAGSKIIGKSFRTTIEKSIEKNPLVSAVGEVVEESAVEFGNQVNDMSSGIRTEFDFHAIKNAGLSATGMGGLQTLGVYGAKGYVKAKDYAKLKSINKEVFKLRSEIDNGNLSPENKAILGLRADRLEAENKKLLGTEIEKAKALPTEAKTELNALNAEFEGLKTKFDDIDDAEDIPANLKPALKEEIRIQAAKNQKRKTEILSQNDGLEVKGDFSKFEGVEPDFDLENGKISSLPLKEQDRLNKLAVEQITGGDKTIEYSKEQVSQTANEIYKNEQTPPTPEAQLQAEVLQQAEAEKVEISDVSNQVSEVETDVTDTKGKIEDVVATSVEKPLSLQEENVSMDNNLRKEKQLEIINKSNPAPNSHNTWVRTVDDIKEAKDVFETAFNDGEMYPDFTVDDMKESLDSGEITIHSSRPIKNGSFVTPSRMNAEEYAGGKGSKIYSKTIKINDVAWIDESEGQYAPIKENKNAKPSKENTPTNGNVQLGASNVGESGNAKPKSNSKSSVQSSVDGGEVKGDASVGEKAKTWRDFISYKETQKIPESIQKMSENQVRDLLANKKSKLEHSMTSRADKERLKYEVWDLQDLVIAYDKANESNKLANEMDNFDFAKAIENSKNEKPLTEAEIQAEKDKENEEWYQKSSFDKKWAKTYKEAKGKLLDKIKESEATIKEWEAKVYKKGAGNKFVGGELEGKTVNLDRVNENRKEKVIKNAKQDIADAKKDLKEMGISENEIKPTETPQPKSKGDVGKIIEPHSEVNTDVETVKKELKLNDVESLIYDSFKGISKDETVDKVDDVVEKWKDDKFGEIEAIESKINDIDIKIEDNGDAIDKIDDDETLSVAKKKKAIAVLEKEFKDLQKQQKELEEQKEAVNESLKQIDDVLFHPTEDYNVDLINEVVGKVNNRLETRKSVKEGTNLFPEDANIPEFVAVKKELIKLTDEKTIADFNSRTAEQVKESEPIIADIKSKAKNAERISKEELEKGIADAEKLLENKKTDGVSMGKSRPVTDLDIAKSNLKFALIARDEASEYLKTTGKNPFADKVTYNKAKLADAKRRIKSLNAEIDKLTNLKEVVSESPKVLYQYKGVDVVKEEDLTTKSGVKYKKITFVDGKNTTLTESAFNSFKKEQIELYSEGISEGVNEGVKNPPTTKERIAERIKLSDAKVDNIKDAINGIDSIFGIKIKVDDIEGLNKNGIDIVEVIANIAKQAIAAGIHIDEAISKTIEHLKKTIDFDVNIDEIKERINPKKEADNDFKSKKGKKSLLGRLIEGGNPDVITKAVKELGENYDVRNQQEANDEAMAFIDKVGASEALKAIKDGLITNSDVKMLIYDEAITRLKTEISDEMNSNPEDREALIKKFQEVSDDFDRAIRDAGQGIAIMNYIYNKNQTLKYNLKKQIADWKRNDPNNEIPADIKAKYEELDQKLKDLEEKTKDAEVRAKKAEDELAIKNIQEDVERKNQAARKNKSGLTPQEQNRKKQLRDKFARANDVTGIPALLVDPEFREYLGLVLKTAKGDFANFSNEILKDLGKTARQHLPELFSNAGGKGDVKVTDLQSITIREEGKIKIPAQILRDYVEQGYTDIDEIAALIKDDIADEFPDADVRDIRDALTGYGKQINPNKDEITAQVNKLKEYGRLLSAYDDVMNGEMPKKSGLVRPKSEQKARELRRNINRLAKELNLEPVDLENQWANAVDKVKSHLKNQIEDLDKQIANGEKRKVDRTPIKLDEEATALKAIRDAKKQILDDLVGKPELTEEQKIANAEKSLDNSIKKLQEEIDTNDIAFKEKPTAVNSKKIEQLKANKKALLETKKQLRQEAGLIEQQRLKTTKTRIKNQIEDLNTRIKNKDFAKKEVKPILADSELNTLRAEKEAVYEEYEKMKYLQELKNRTFAKKLMDEGLEALGLARAIKASLDLGLIGIQLRGFTYSELWRNPKELAHKFIKMFGAIGSQNKTNKAMSELIGHPLHALAKKLDIGMTHPDLRNEVREEMASGNLLHFIWSSPVLAVEALGGKEAMNSKRTSIGDSFIDSVKKQYNKLFQNYQVDIKQKEKFSVKEQWKNINAFEAVERGLSIYGNQLRFEEFVRGVDRLKAEGKDEINHLEDYKELASYIRTFSGRAKPMGFELNQKALNVFFFSFKNMASVIQQLNPYYMLIELNKSNLKRGVYKPTVANKMAMATMFKSVVSTSATLLFVMAAYNAFKDDDEEEATIEKDPRSSDFGKLKIGNFRYDPWGGYIPLISLYARLATEEVKKSDGTISKFGEDRFGIQNRGDAASRFLINKESPGFQMFHKYMTSTEEVDKATGETYRATPFGGKLSEEDAYSFYPIFLGSVKSAKEKDYEGVQAFLTAYSILGLGNVQEYETKEKKPKSSKKGVPGVPNFGRMKINP